MNKYLNKQDIKMSNFTHILVTYRKEILKHNSNPSTKKTQEILILLPIYFKKTQLGG